MKPSFLLTKSPAPLKPRSKSSQLLSYLRRMTMLSCTVTTFYALTLSGGSMKTNFWLVLLLVCSYAHTVSAHGKAAAAESSERMIQFPDVDGYVTLVADLHTHSVFSDGHVWPKIRVEEALRDGLDALAITEHLEYQPHRADIPHPDRNRSFQEASAAAEGSGLIVIAGSEITREQPTGHINAVFLQDANALFKPLENAPDDAVEYYKAAQEWPSLNAIDAANEQGAFLFINHPYWTAQKPNGIAELSKLQSKAVKAGKLHGVEVANGQDYSEEAFAFGLKNDLTLIGVSDIHDLVDWDYEPHNGGHRPVTLILAKERSAEAAKEALFAKRTVVWFRNLLIGRSSEVTALLNASLKVSGAKYQKDTEVVEVLIDNNSDASFALNNKSGYSFMHYGDRIVVPPHAQFALVVKPGKKVPQFSLTFDVENALVAPKTPATIKFQITPQSESHNK